MALGEGAVSYERGTPATALRAGPNSLSRIEDRLSSLLIGTTVPMQTRETEKGDLIPLLGAGGSRGTPDNQRNVQRFRRGIVFKAHRLLFHSTSGLRVIKRRDETTNAPSSHLTIAPARAMLSSTSFLEAWEFGQFCIVDYFSPESQAFQFKSHDLVSSRNRDAFPRRRTVGIFNY